MKRKEALMYLAEQHRIDRHDPRWQVMDTVTFASKHLYNAALYITRQAYIHQDHQLTLPMGKPRGFLLRRDAPHSGSYSHSIGVPFPSARRYVLDLLCMQTLGYRIWQREKGSTVIQHASAFTRRNDLLRNR